MKKLLLIAILMLALVFTVVACTGGDTTNDTTVGDTTVETPTDAPTEEPTDAPTEEPTDAPTEEPTDAPTDAPTEKPTEPPTEPPTEAPTADPMEPVLVIEPDQLISSATSGNKVSAGEATTEGNRTFVPLASTGGDPYFQILSGAGVEAGYLAIAYRTNCPLPGEIFIGSGGGPNGQGDFFSIDWNEDGAWNFMVIDLANCGVTSITDGVVNYLRLDIFTDHMADKTLDIQYMAFFKSAEAANAYDFKVNPPYVEAAEAGQTSASFDTFYVNNQMYFPEDGGAGDKLTAQNNTITFAVGEAHESMILRGWIGFGQPIESFGYYLDNYKMVFNPDYTKPTEDGVKAAGGEHASRFEILVPLAQLVSNDHFAGFVAKLADGTIARLRADITVDLPDDITDTFVSNVASNEDGTDLQASDLSNYFTITYGAADPHVVSGGVYQYGGINELYTTVDGLYAFSINMREAANTAMAFVRGTRVVHSVDLPEVDAAAGLYPINNYYETDGQGRMGGAGIYAALYNGRLNLMIKSYDDEARTHQINRDYSIVAEGTNLTIADNGSTIYFLVDGNLLATVALSGSTSYEKICDLAEGITFAQTAVVTLADGTTDTIENTLVVDTVQSQLGIAVRPATIKFDSIKVEGLSSVTIPSEFYVPVPKENVALNKPVDADSVENDANIPANATDGNESTRWGALPNGAANLIVDLGDVYDLIGLDVFFENAGWEYTISLSQDGVDYTVIAENVRHGSKMVSIKGEASARYIKFSRLDDSADAATPHWFSIWEVYAYTKAAEDEPEEPVVPEVETLVIPQDQWVISGHCTTLVGKEGHPNSPMVAAGGVDSAALLHQGSIALGEIDLSKYSKVVIMWGSDNGDGTKDLYAKNEHNRFALVNADKNMVMSPAEDTIIAAATYELHGWAVAPIEIDLTGIDYNGPVFLTHDSLAGGFALVYSIEFIA